MKEFTPRKRRYRRKTSVFRRLITGFMIICLSYLVLHTFTGCKKQVKHNCQPLEEKES